MKHVATYYCELLDRIIWKVPLSNTFTMYSLADKLAAEATETLQYHRGKHLQKVIIFWDEKSETFKHKIYGKKETKTS